MGQYANAFLTPLAWVMFFGSVALVFGTVVYCLVVCPILGALGIIK